MSNTLAELVAQRRDHPREFALGAIGRLNERRTGMQRFDAWIEYAVRDWHNFIREHDEARNAVEANK